MMSNSGKPIVWICLIIFMSLALTIIGGVSTAQAQDECPDGICPPEEKKKPTIVYPSFTPTLTATATATATFTPTPTHTPAPTSTPTITPTLTFQQLGSAACSDDTAVSSTVTELQEALEISLAACTTDACERRVESEIKRLACELDCDASESDRKECLRKAELYACHPTDYNCLQPLFRKHAYEDCLEDSSVKTCDRWDKYLYSWITPFAAAMIVGFAFLIYGFGYGIKWTVNAFKDAGNWFKGAANSTANWFKGAGNTIGKTTTSTTKKVTKSTEKAAEKVADTAKDVGKDIKKTGKKAGKKIKKLFK
jgi:hypothetical protein